MTDKKDIKEGYRPAERKDYGHQPNKGTLDPSNPPGSEQSEGQTGGSSEQSEGQTGGSSDSSSSD